MKLELTASQAGTLASTLNWVLDDLDGKTGDVFDAKERRDMQTVLERLMRMGEVQP